MPHQDTRWRSVGCLLQVSGVHGNKTHVSSYPALRLVVDPDDVGEPRGQATVVEDPVQGREQVDDEIAPVLQQGALPE